MNVKVVLSCYNGANNIERQLDSIFHQVGVDVSVLIRDDGSADESLRIIRKYASSHPDKRLEILEGKNTGYAWSFWLGLRQAGDADYYAFSDQDDYWDENKLIKCIEKFDDRHPDTPQLCYCRMTRSDTSLAPLREQVNVLKPEQLSKKLVLTQTYNYGAATVFNISAKELICRVFPQKENVPHDMWCGLICYWFGSVYYVDESLYHWIRYSSSVTGEGTRLSGIKYRVKETLKGKSYINVADELINYYNDLLSDEDRIFLEMMVHYQNNLKYKFELLRDCEFRRKSILGTVVLKMGILFNKL
nr:glycosyltransferase [uncultured Acetatifactor sp.]